MNGRVTSASDGGLIDEIIAKHKDYLAAIDHMFKAVDAGDTKLATDIDGAEVDPTFEFIEERVFGAAESRRADTARHLRELGESQRMILIATPIVFVPGLGLLLFIWSQLQRYRRNSENALIREAAAFRHSEQRLRSLVENTSDVVLICSPDGVITYQSSSVETAWGFEPSSLIGKSLINLVQREDQPALRDLMEQLKKTPGTMRSIEVHSRKAEGLWRHVDLLLKNLQHDPNVAGLVVTVRDITERKAFEQQLTEQAFFDTLTGLPNRLLFRDRLDQAWARAGHHRSNVGLLFIDLDNFKHVNDSFGHKEGDEVLAEAAKRLRACIRVANTIARLGGDEFVVLLEHLTGPDDAVEVANRIAEAFAKPFKLDGRDITVTASIGISLGNADQELADNMLRDADVAMYRAKSDGKARHIVFDATMQTDALARMVAESDLRLAVKRGEFVLHYQPILVLETGQVVEVEALVRWQHPTRGLVAPEEFIPIAEETGLIVAIGQWVLEEACRQVAAWRMTYQADPPLMVSVNLSPRQFQQSDLVECVKRALHESGLPATGLKLEITEGAIMRDVETTIATLWRLKDLGIQIAIDDFGTGYSSLAYLKRLPLDVLKIDRSFINGIVGDREDSAIVQAIIAMAKSLDLSITAEGIETADQSALLRSWHCDLGQGFYFAKPLDVTTFTEMLDGKEQPPGRTAAA